MALSSPVRRSSIVSGVRKFSFAEIRYEGTIIALESEIKDFPRGTVRVLWAPYALAMKDAEAARIEERWKKGILEACRKIAEA